MISSETNVVNDDHTVEDINSGSLLTPVKSLEIDNIANVLDLECLNEKVSTAHISATVDNIDDTLVNNDSTNNIDNILRELELPSLLDPLKSLDEFINNL